MKRILIFLFALLPLVVWGQQFPFMEGYNVNPFNLSPAFAGIHNGNTLFIDYRSDWTGLEGGPTTYQLSYSHKFENKVGLGGRFIYDKTDIFKQMLFLGTYTYGVNIAKVHTLTFGLSVGFYKNSIDFAKYYNNPDYVQDIALIYSLEKSKIKFATDISALYSYKQIEAGIVFSNIMFGTARYSNTDLTYKPLKNYLVHASYLLAIGEKWFVNPTLLLRGGQHIPFQAELAPTFTWNDRFWVTPFYRTGGVFGMGLGGEIFKGLLLNYTYNMSSNVSLNTFTSHQITLGVRLFNTLKTKTIIE
jgi:type IX secretion system PorP/SprF family membrane protein